MSATIELDRSLETNGRGYVGLGHSLGQFLLGDIEIVDVGCVVFAVVELHYLGTYHRLQGIVVVGKVGQSVLVPRAEIIKLMKINLV